MTPSGRDRQVLFDFYGDIHVILPTEGGIKSIAIGDLMPLPMRWSIDGNETSLAGHCFGAARPHILGAWSALRCEPIG
jgi:hypothetical protein